MLLKIQRLTISIDSQLVIKKVKGAFNIKDPKMVAYVEVIKLVMTIWESIKVNLIDRSSNEEADILAIIGETQCPNEGRWIQVEVVTPSASSIPSLNLIDLNFKTNKTRILIKKYITKGGDPKDLIEKRRIGNKVAHFALIDEELYKKSLHERSSWPL